MPESTTSPTVTADPNTAAPTAVTDPNATGGGGGGEATPESWAKSWLKSDGSFDHSAFEKAPDEIKAARKGVERYKTADEWVKGFRELEKLASTKGIVDPLPENASDAQKAERSALLRKVNGAPEKPEGYGLARPADLPENQWNQELATSVAQLAHKYGVAPEFVREVAAAQVAALKKDAESVRAQEKAWFDKQDSVIREIAQKEGMNYDQAATFAQKAGRRFGISPDNPVMKNASVLLALARIGKLMGEDKLVTGDVNDFAMATNMNAEQAQKEATAIQSDKNHPLYAAYWNRDGKHSPEDVDKARATQRKFSMLAHSQRPARR